MNLQCHFCGCRVTYSPMRHWLLSSRDSTGVRSLLEVSGMPNMPVKNSSETNKTTSVATYNTCDVRQPCEQHSSKMNE